MARRQRHMKKKGGDNFWNKEYAGKTHLELSTNPSEDLEDFCRWLLREHGKRYLNQTTSVLDLGCGNGRNLIYLAREFGMKGVGYDISSEAISQAKSLSKDLPITYEVRSIAGKLEAPDASQTIVLDMMASHFLNKEERAFLRGEIVRILKPYGWLFWKTFLLDEDKHAERLLREFPAPEEGSYIHPEIGKAEHVFTEDEIHEALDEHFIVHKITKSHRHLLHGKAFKRRSISVYAQRKG